MIAAKKAKVVHFSHCRYYLPIRLSLTLPQKYQYPNGSLSETQRQFKKLVDECLIVSQQQEELIMSLAPRKYKFYKQVMKQVMLKQLEKYQRQVQQNNVLQLLLQKDQRISQTLYNNIFLGQTAQSHAKVLQAIVLGNSKQISPKQCIKTLINLRFYFNRKHQIAKEAVRIITKSQLLQNIISKFQNIINNWFEGINTRFGQRGNEFEVDMLIIHDNNEKIDVLKVLLIQIINFAINSQVQNAKKETDMKQGIDRQKVEIYLRMAMRVENITNSGVNSVEFIVQSIKLLKKCKQLTQICLQKRQQLQNNNGSSDTASLSSVKKAKQNINQLNVHNILTYTLQYQIRGQVYSSSFLQIFIQSLAHNNNLLQVQAILYYIHDQLQEIKAINELLSFASACMNLKFLNSLQKIESRIRIKDYTVQSCKNIQVTQRSSFYLQNNHLCQTNNLTRRIGSLQSSQVFIQKAVGRSDQSRPFSVIKISEKQFIMLHKSVIKVTNKLKDAFNKLRQGKIDFQKYQPTISNISHQKRVFLVQKQRIREASNLKQVESLNLKDQNDNENSLNDLNNEQKQILKSLTQKLSDRILLQTKQIQQSHKQLQQSKSKNVQLEAKLSQKDVLVFNLQKIVGQYINIGDRQKYLKKTNHNKLRLTSNNLSYKIDCKLPKQFPVIVNNFNIANDSSLSPATTEKPRNPPPSLSQTLKNLNNKSENQNIIKEGQLSSQIQNTILPFLPINLPSIPPLNIPIPPPLTLTLNDANRTSRKLNGKKYANEVKTISWSVVEPSQIKDSFWQQVSETQLNQDQIFKHFGRKEKKLSENRNSSQSQSLQKKKQDTKQKKSLISSDRVKNIQIVLTKFRIEPRIIQEIIINFDQRYISQQKVQCLLNIIPTEKQYEIFAPIEISQQQIGQWTLADYYLCIVTKLDNYKQRLQAILFKFEFQNQKIELMQKCKYFCAYFSGLMRDPLLKLFMKYLLNIGNYLNSNSFRGTACGIKLECIDRTYSFIGQQTTVSLFQYVMECVWRNQIIQSEETPLFQAYKQQSNQQQQHQQNIAKQSQQKKKKISLRQQIYKVYNSSIEYPVIGLKRIEQQISGLERQYRNIEQCLASIQLQNPTRQQIGQVASQSQFLKKQLQKCRDRVTEYLLPFYVRLQQDILIMKDQLAEAREVLAKFQLFYCDKSQSEKIMEIIKKFRGKVRQFMNKKVKQRSKHFNQFQVLKARGRFSLVTSSN